MRKIDEIIVHCTATPRGRDVRLADVDLYHREMGFAMIGYHYLIYTDGRIMRGRPEEVAGAHCLGHNGRSIGVCYVGGCDEKMRPKDTRTDAQRRSLEELLRDLCSRYPHAKIHSHSDFAAKACPSFDATGEYKHLCERHE